MKIDSSAFKPTSAPLNQATAKPTPPSPSTTDAVSISNVAGILKSGEAVPVNSAKVQEIKEAIAQGRFKINPEAIASSLLDTARELINKQRTA